MSKFCKFFIFGTLMLAGCGGSGSSSVTLQTSGSTGTNSPSIPINLTLDRSTATFSARQFGIPSEPQTIIASWSGASIVDVTTGFSNGAEQPDWLRITKTGTVSPAIFELEISDTDLESGQYLTTFEITGNDSDGNTVRSEPVTVNFNVRSFGSANRANQDSVFHFGQEIVLNGANVAWSENTGNWFNHEIGAVDSNGQPRTNITAFETRFNTIAEAGGNSARVWLHTGANVTPVIEVNGIVTSLSRDLTNAQVIDQLHSILDAAWAEGILVTFNLFSFNMICDSYQPQAAKRMLENNVQSYIDNALTPMVTGLKDHPALFAWDIFNEPEGMRQTDYFCPSTEIVTTQTVQSVVNQSAAAIHDLDPNVKVTTSTHTDLFDEYANATLETLPNARAGGTLDFYSLHWYGTGWQVSPYITTAVEYNADRPIVAGEFDPENTGNSGPSAQNSSRVLLENGYIGVWPWSLTTGDTAIISSAITEAATLAPAINKSEIEACLMNKSESCYTE